MRRLAHARAIHFLVIGQENICASVVKKFSRGCVRPRTSKRGKSNDERREESVRARRRRGFAHLLGALLLVPAISLPSAAQAPLSTNSEAAEGGSATTPFVGCYQVRVGRWWPWSFGEDTVFVTPPSRIRLLSQRGTEGFEHNGFIIRVLPPDKQAVHGIRRVSSYWTVKSSKDVDLVWTDGLTGFILRLHKRGNDLRGWAHPHFDFPHFISRTAYVKARKMPCDGPGSAPSAP